MYKEQSGGKAPRKFSFSVSSHPGGGAGGGRGWSPQLTAQRKKPVETGNSLGSGAPGW